MQERKPDAERILDNLMHEKTTTIPGKLKVFFGYAPGVGKTYAMLDAAHEAQKSGFDVVVGWIAPNSKPETVDMLDGLEILPPLKIKSSDGIIEAFNLDLAIKRHPQLILIDELAHINAQAYRNVNRYQDIEELLKAGIDVYTTVNVESIESLNDIVVSITGIKAGERIPDKVLDEADQIELVDIEPEELIARFYSGKIYKNIKEQGSIETLYTKEKLVALREIALRRTADKVNKEAQKSKIFAHETNYYTNEHILICLSSSPSNAKVIRTAARMASAFHGSFTALFVQTPGTKELSDQNRVRLRANLKLAEQLGAKIATVYGENVPEQIAEYSKVSGVSKIIIGRSNNKKSIFPQQSFVEKLTQLAPNLDIYIIPDSVRTLPAKKQKRAPKSATLILADFFKLLLILAASTWIGIKFDKLGFSEANIITVYILGVLVTAVFTNGRRFSVISSFLSVIVFNFFFTTPRYSLEAYDAGYPVTFFIMFVASFLTSTLTMRVKEQAYQNALKAKRTEVLLETSQKLQRAENREQIYLEMGKQVQKLLDKTVLIYPVSKENTLCPMMVFTGDDLFDKSKYLSNEERSVAEWVLKNNKNAGATTNTSPTAKCFYIAVRGHDSVYAVVAVVMDDAQDLDAYDKNLFMAMLGEFGLVLEKERINEIKNDIDIQAQREQLRANLLRAISHDLRTPLTSISGNAGILMKNSKVLDENKKNQLYSDIYDDSIWLINLVENLLSVTRIENGTMNIGMQPELIDEVISEALRHISRKASEYKITVNMTDDLLMAKMDSRLIVQVIINIVDNAIKYTEPGSRINISAKKKGDKVLIEISDNGKGISDRDKAKLFDMFFTVERNTCDGRRGLGLGLSLCKSIVNAHGSELTVRDNVPNGTVFSFTLQSEEVNISE